MILDLCHRFKWGLITPHRIEGTIPASRNAVIGGVAFVGAYVVCSHGLSAMICFFLNWHLGTQKPQHFGAEVLRVLK
jgi:hypothetical protein